MTAAEKAEQAARLRAIAMAALKFESAGQTFAAVAEDMKRLGLELRR